MQPLWSRQIQFGMQGFCSFSLPQRKPTPGRKRLTVQCALVSMLETYAILITVIIVIIDIIVTFLIIYIIVIIDIIVFVLVY